MRYFFKSLNILKIKFIPEIYRSTNGITQIFYGIWEIILTLVYFSFLAAINFWFIYYYPFFYFYSKINKKKSYFYLFFQSWQSLLFNGLRTFYSGILNVYSGLMEVYMTLTDPLLEVFLLGDLLVFFNVLKLLFDSYFLEGIDNLLHKQKIIHLDSIYHNYVGLYLEGRNYQIPPRDEYDFLFFLHDLENTNIILENCRTHTSDYALDQRQKLFVNKHGYLNLTIQQKRAIRKTRLLGRLGKLTSSSLFGKYLFKPLVSFKEDYSIAYWSKQDKQNFYKNKKRREQFIQRCLQKWQKNKMLGVKNYAPKEKIKKWLDYYWEIGYIE